MSDSVAEESLSLLARLSQKPGVQSTLVLSRDTGAILRSSGLIAQQQQQQQQRPGSSDSSKGIGTDAAGGTNGQSSGGGGDEAGGMQSGDHVAKQVWRFMKSASSLVDELDGEDELRLLRVRTRKNELVIVPNAKFLLVVIHDTPPA